MAESTKISVNTKYLRSVEELISEFQLPKVDCASRIINIYRLPRAAKVPDRLVTCISDSNVDINSPTNQ